VLDVGCGRAAFLHRLATERHAIVTGLEFNESAAAFGRERGVDVLTESIEQHASQRQGHYDCVTSFQVLEHVIAPAQFLRACVEALKPGGQLVIGVPNNDGFLGLIEENWLNMPPHHMTLWGKSCLEGISNRFCLEHVSTDVEPLQERAWYQAVFEKLYLKGRIRQFIYYKLGFDAVFRGYIDSSWMTIPGHTIVAVFRKPAESAAPPRD
jgi:2-polyprenyl-3-methyl-5-hydroxy-6-metoxy-1,4-benzoquinol methylase